MIDFQYKLLQIIQRTKPKLFSSICTVAGKEVERVRTCLLRLLLLTPIDFSSFIRVGNLIKHILCLLLLVLNNQEKTKLFVNAFFLDVIK